MAVFYEPNTAHMSKIGAERGRPPRTRAQFEAEVKGGSLCVGSAETVARRIAGAIKAVGASRFDLAYSAGALPASARLRAVELYGTKVVPMVRDLVQG